ncbi:Uncharacterised protein [uncultured archaeon]|nr:Uncharacterised protein [uncultured archaeon]
MQIFISIQKFTYMMNYSNGKVAGVLFIIASSQFILGLIVAEALYPGYSISTNYISDLGIGPSSTVFNVSIFLIGLLSIIGAYFLQRAFHHKEVTISLTIAALAAMGVGIFTENSEPMHMLVSLLVFLFGGLSAIFSYRLMKNPFNIIVILLGLMSLLMLIFFIGNFYLGLGVGGMERMIVYPILIWMIGSGGFLIAFPEKS